MPMPQFTCPIKRLVIAISGYFKLTPQAGVLSFALTNIKGHNQLCQFSDLKISDWPISSVLGQVRGKYLGNTVCECYHKLST